MLERNLPLGCMLLGTGLLQTWGDRGSERVTAGEQRERRAGVGGVRIIRTQTWSKSQGTKLEARCSDP